MLPHDSHSLPRYPAKVWLPPVPSYQMVHPTFVCSQGHIQRILNHPTAAAASAQVPISPPRPELPKARGPHVAVARSASTPQPQAPCQSPASSSAAHSEPVLCPRVDFLLSEACAPAPLSLPLPGKLRPKLSQSPQDADPALK